MSAAELRPTPGTDVLARRGDLVLLCSEGPAVDKLLQAHAEVAAAGGDAEALAARLADVVSGGTELSLVAFGPAGGSVLVTVYGHAWADVTTEHGEQKLAMRQSRDGVRSVVPGRLQSVRAGIGDALPAADAPQWADLQEGVVRAGGLTMVAAGPTDAAQVAAPPEEPATDQLPVVEPAEPTPSLPPPVPSVPPMPPVPSVPAPSGPAEPDRSQQFSSVVLVGGAGGAPQAEHREPLPVITAPPEPLAPDTAPPAHPADEGRVQVLGVYCKNGHFDDPQARYCAVCGISMAQLTLQPRPGPRPPLGVLVLDDGSIFSLDTDYVIGRDPSQDPDVAAGLARPLRFDDPEGVLSRRHARIVLDGWNVEVVDLGSANGTGIWGPSDTAWHAVPTQTPVPMRPGTQVGLGRRSLRYESHRNT
ncbi:MAG TPA: FHA domain-containing protein [Jatrophihabitans sp.]|nr:FHA domain-containing protein [Jatrophihabitans sp.]